MNCIVVDDEPLAREAIQTLVEKTKDLNLINCFSSAVSAVKFLEQNSVDLIFLDIKMPGTNGIDFARTVSEKTLIIFTTAFSDYALQGFEVEAIDYLLKPVSTERFQKAVTKAQSYHNLLMAGTVNSSIESFASDYFFVKADRRIFKVLFKDILFIEGLKDYVVLQTDEQKIITAMNIKTIYDKLPKNLFVRIAKSYIINVEQISSFDNNSVFIQKNELPIGNAYRAYFFDEFVAKKMLSR